MLLFLITGRSVLLWRAPDGGAWLRPLSDPTFSSSVFILFGLADLGGAAGLGLSLPGGRSSEQEVWKVCGGRCGLAGVVDPEALPGTTSGHGEGQEVQPRHHQLQTGLGT